jgi:hypothetical protein
LYFVEEEAKNTFNMENLEVNRPIKTTIFLSSLLVNVLNCQIPFPLCPREERHLK